jgi:hypothetical protein
MIEARDGSSHIHSIDLMPVSTEYRSDEVEDLFSIEQLPPDLLPIV